jgi:hypothetical protein
MVRPELSAFASENDLHRGELERWRKITRHLSLMAIIFLGLQANEWVI